MCLKTQRKKHLPADHGFKKTWLVTSPVLQQSFQVRFAPTPPPTSFFVWPGRLSKRQNREIGNPRNPSFEGDQSMSEFPSLLDFSFPGEIQKSIKRIHNKLARGIRLDTSSDHVYEKVWRRTQQITRNYTTYKLVFENLLNISQYTSPLFFILILIITDWGEFQLLVNINSSIFSIDCNCRK